MQPVGQASGFPFSALVRDRIVQVFVLLLVLLNLPYFLPIVSEEMLIYVVEDYLALVPLLFTLAVLSIGIGRVSDSAERRFWIWLSTAFGFWIAVRLFYVALPDIVGTPAGDIPGDVLYLLFYLSLVLAAESRPHERIGGRAASLSQTFETAGALIFGFVLLVYFVIVPSSVNYAAYSTWLPSLYMYVALDLYLLIRFVRLRRIAKARRFRLIYGLIAGATAIWAVTDLLECLSYAGRFDLSAAGPLNLLWEVPFLLFVFAGRMRRRRVGGEDQRATEAAETAHRVSAWRAAVPIVLMAFSFPLAHFSLYGFDILDQRSRSARELVVFFALLALGLLLVLHQSLLEKRNRALESDLELATHKLQHSQKMEAIGRLAGGVAHDFNNLLTAITGHAQLLIRRVADADVRKDLVEIDKAAERAASLTRQLLAFSRRQVLLPSVLDVNSVVSDMESMLVRLIGEDVELITFPGCSIGHVKAERGQLEQVIMNLAVNARDAMPHGGRLTLETTELEVGERRGGRLAQVAPGRYVLLSISDTGCGLDAETQARIFEPFFTTKAPGKGTGLGLSTVYGIVVQSGGAIWIESEPGRGATFNICLPVVDEPLDPVPATRTEQAASGANNDGRTVLLVEDEPAVRELIREILELDGFAVLEAGSGEEALDVQQAHGGKIDLLLTDVVMPGMSGPQLAEHLGPIRPDMKVLYVSGYNDEKIFRHGLSEPGRAFLHKPFTPDLLISRVLEILAPSAVGAAIPRA